jgi:hypothetical protein
VLGISTRTGIKRMSIVSILPLRRRPRTQLHMSGAAEPRMRSDMACHDRRESCRVRRSTVSPPSDVKVRTEQ